jgi:NADH:ubiquinone reductase (H+-translocating)
MNSTRPRVVIVGGGFGGLLAAQNLKRSPVDITIIDRRNYHLFQPLLYQVATGGLSPANIAAPLRTIFKYQKNIRTIMGEVIGFDVAKKQVMVKDHEPLSFEYLILAAGATHHYFGKDADWEPKAPGLKTIEDATEIRRKVLVAFEKAERETNPEAIKRLLTFIVVGGGPTGVEMAGAICELAKSTMVRDFRSIDPRSARIILVENSALILQSFHQTLSEKGRKSLEALGCEVWSESRMIDIQLDHVIVTRNNQTHRIDTETVVWAAGVKGSPLGKMLTDSAGIPATVDKGGRVVVNPDCSVPGHPNLFAIGDLMSMAGSNGKPLPGVCPVAMQQGQYVAKLIDREVNQKSRPGPFRYWDKGSMATIGRSKAILESGWLRMSGFLAWLGWLFIHVLYLIRFENRLLVLFQWGWNFLTRNRSARLITGTNFSDVPSETKKP